MFAALYFERDPLSVADLQYGLLAWVQIAGGFGLLGATLWMIFRLPQWRAQDYQEVPFWQRALFVGSWLLGAVGCAAGWVLYALARQAGGAQKPDQVHWFVVSSNYAFLAGGIGGLLAAGTPFVLGLARMRLGRIFALASLSFKEALQARVLVVFALLAPVFLFGSWFITSKPQDQLRTYVWVVFFVMGVLLLAASALISAFSIPADIQRQTIHTIVTKPVERFEIALGRFLGFYTLMTLALITMTALSLVYVLRGVGPESAAESLLAREPLYGELRFLNTGKTAGINVGREWDYRRYITANPGQAGAPQTALWLFPELDGRLALETPKDGPVPQVLVEYTFDVYRTTKGEEGRDVTCTIEFRTWRSRPEDRAAFEAGRKKGDARLDDALAEKHGYFAVHGQRVTDYRIQSFTVPAGLFRNALGDPGKWADLKAHATRQNPAPPALEIRVTCEKTGLTQYVGMAKYDLFLRLDRTEASAWLFSVNFLKAAFGLWLTMGLVIGLAVVFSTYLNGVISLLLCVLLFLGGFFSDFIRQVALNQNPGGGPMEAMRTIASRQVTSVKTDASQSVSDIVVNQTDEGFRFVVQVILRILPDVERYNMTNYLAEGFNVPPLQLLITFLLMVGYLLPWFVLAYYLLAWREIAAAT